MVIAQRRSTIAFLHSLMYGGQLFQFLPNLQPVRVLSAPRTNVMPCAGHELLTQDMAFGMHHSHEQNATHGAAPGLQACLSALGDRGNDALGFVLLFRLEHFIAQRLNFSFWDTAWRSALFLLFSVSPEQY